MKIEYRQTGAGGSYSTLVDESAGGTVEPWEPSYSQTPQVESLASNSALGNSVFINTLGNIQCKVSIHRMNVIYSTRAAALAASRTVPAALLNVLNNLKVTESTEVQYFPSSVVQRISANVQGANVTYSIELTSKMVTATEP